MRMIMIILVWGCLVLGCDSKPQEATEVPEDLMREIAMEAARETIKIEGPAILMIEAGEQIRQQAEQAGAKAARGVAAEESRKILDQAQVQKLEARIGELERRFNDLKISLEKESSPKEPPK